MNKLVCENCNHLFYDDAKKIGLVCPKCGNYEVTEVGKVVNELSEYESIIND